MFELDPMKRPRAVRSAERSDRSRTGKRPAPRVRKRPLSEDEREFRLFAAAAGAAIAVLTGLVAALVMQLP